jgi:hypothetical protein
MAIVTYLMVKEFARSLDWRIEADRILAKLKGGK